MSTSGEAVAVAVDAVVSANSKFGHDLHSVLVRGLPPSANVVHSAFSLSSVLAMVKHGARGETSHELELVCHFPKNDETLPAGYNHLLTAIKDANKGTGIELVCANRLYVQHGFEVKAAFSSILEHLYQSGPVKRLNFELSDEASAEINGWVGAVTKNKIKDLISPQALNEETRLVLVNGVYFKGLWKAPFRRSNTTWSSFRTGPEEVRVNMMHIKHKFPYVELESAQVVELPYQGDQLAMLIFLPKGDTSLEELHEQCIVDDDYETESLLKRMSRSNAVIELSLPRFRVESRHELVEPLKKLGLVTAFDPVKADFSGMTERVRDSKGLYVSQVVQKAFIKVNEEGTEAAAATGAVCRDPSRERVIRFNADHPFNFQIIHKPSRLVLFGGAVHNPAAA